MIHHCIFNSVFFRIIPPGTIYATYTVKPAVIIRRQWVGHYIVQATEISRHLDYYVDHGTNNDHVSVSDTLGYIAMCLYKSDKSTDLWASLAQQIFFKDLYGTQTKRDSIVDGSQYSVSDELSLTF